MRATRDVGRESEVLRDAVRTPAIDRAITLAISGLLDTPTIDTKLGGERLRAFLQSPELLQLMRQIYSDQVVHPKRPNPDIQHQFVQLLQLWTSVDPAVANEHGPRLLKALRNGCQRALASALRRGSIEALDARAVARNGLLIDELDNLAHAAKHAQTHAQPDVTAILSFDRTYRDQVRDRETMVTLPSLDDKVLRHVDEVYVPPRLHRGTAAAEPRSLTTIRNDWRRTVVLGSPGAGKSTLVRHLVARIADGDLRLSDGTDRTPVVVILREYAEAKAKRAVSIVEFIEEMAAARYQIRRVPDGAFEYLLRYARAYVLFDGLDELLETKARADISADVMSFAALYPTTPVLVTSRVVGYDEAPLRPDRFVRWQIADFDVPQIESYADRMLTADDSVPADRRATLLAAFMDKSRGLGNLRANPLMLGLLVRLYMKTQDLPVHRAGVLESCALLLFERWDGDRGIFVPFPFQSRLKPAMQHIAHAVYTEPRLQKGVSSTQLVAITTEYLHGRRYEDADEARAAAGEFIALCKGRTWVFADTGASVEGDPLFEFTHRSFMEFFVAGHLVRHHRTPSDLLRALEGRILSREWEMVCQLAFHMRAREQEHAADELLLGALLAGGAISPTGGDPGTLGRVARSHTATAVVTFCHRALSVLVPDVPALRTLATAWFAELAIAVGSPEQRADEIELLDLVLPLVGVNDENWGALSAGIVGTAADRLRGDMNISGVSRAVADILMSLDCHLDPESPAAARWWQTGRALARELGPVVASPAPGAWGLAYDGLRFGVLDLDDWLGRHRFCGLFVPRAVYGMPSLTVGPVAQRLLDLCALEPDISASPEARDKSLELLGQIGARIPEHLPKWGQAHTRWSGGQRVTVPFSRWAGRQTALASTSAWSTDQLFAMCCIAGALHELDPAHRMLAGSIAQRSGDRSPRHRGDAATTDRSRFRRTRWHFGPLAPRAE